MIDLKSYLKGQEDLLEIIVLEIKKYKEATENPLPADELLISFDRSLKQVRDKKVKMNSPMFFKRLFFL